MSLKRETVDLLLELERFLAALLRATAPDDHQRRNRLTHLIARAGQARSTWDARWEHIAPLLEKLEKKEQSRPKRR